MSTFFMTVLMIVFNMIVLMIVAPKTQSCPKDSERLKTRIHVVYCGFLGNARPLYLLVMLQNIIYLVIENHYHLVGNVIELRVMLWVML